MLTWILSHSVVLILLSFLDGGVATAGPSPSVTPEQIVSTTVTSQRMTFKNQDGQAVFDGSVVLKRGALIVYSDKMVVSFREQDHARIEGGKSVGVEEKASSVRGPDTVSNRAVSQIEAIGRVKIERETGNATCQKAVYYRDEDKIVLTGDPVAWDKGTRVSGRRITLYLAEDRTVVEGGSHVQIEPDREAR